MKFFKPLLMIVSAVCMMCIITGCPKPHEPNTLSVDPTALTFTAVDAPRQPLIVTTDADDWSSLVTEQWVTTEKSGNILYVSVQNNTDINNGRIAIITFAAGDAPSVSVRVNQSAKARDNLSISPASLTFNGNETSAKPVTVTTNAPSWSATASESWVTLTTSGSTLNVRVSTNPSTTQARNAIITVKAGDAENVICTVLQNPAPISDNLTVSPTTSLTFAYNSTAPQNYTVTTNASSYKVSYPTSATWLQVIPDGKTVTVRPTSQNTSTTARSATLTFEAGNATPVTRVVTQNGQPQPTTAQVRFRKSFYNDVITGLSILNSSGAVVVSYNFGASSGTSGYYTVTAGSYVPGVCGNGICIPFQEDFSWNLQAGYKYTLQLTLNGEILTYTRITDDTGGIINNNIEGEDTTITIPKTSVNF